MNKTKAYIIGFLPSVVIILILIFVKPCFQNTNWLTYLIISAPPAILIILLFNANRELKQDDKSALSNLKESLESISYAERLGVALAQPFRSIQLKMPISSIDYSMYMTRRLSSKARHYAAFDFAVFTSGIIEEGFDWATYVGQIEKEPLDKPNEAWWHCRICHIIVCGIEVGEFSLEEGLVLLVPLENKILQSYSSWNDYGKVIRKAVLASPNYSFRGKLGYRVHFRDLKKSSISPWNLIPWERSET